MKRNFAIGFFFVAGLLFVCMAVFAQSWGLDNNTEWGRGRYLLLFLGLGSISVSLFFSKVESMVQVGRAKLLHLLQTAPIVVRWMDQHPGVVNAAKHTQGYFFVIPLAALVLLVYIWFISLGLWTTWPPRSAYYSLLARGFLKHELFLPIDPSPKLLMLSNPYDPAQRIGVGEPLDISLYNGKFYLYWGPVPALILAGLNLIFSQNLADLYLVFGFSCGLFFVQTTLMLNIWERYFHNLPKWILGMWVLLAGLAVPSTVLLGRADIYEAAIAGGQFFVMAGFATTFSVIVKNRTTKIKLLLAGTCWALAVGTRLSLILPIGFLMFVVAYKLLRDTPSQLSHRIQNLVCLGLPMAIGLSLLAWYNWARFESFSETGFTYALAGTYIQKHLHEVISYRYIIQNLYNYLLVPLQIQDQFPYLISNDGSLRSVLPSFYDLPEFYGSNPITGMIYIAPFIFFSLILLNKNAWRIYQAQSQEADTQFWWLVFTLSGAALAPFIFLLVFFWAAMRYVLDFMPMLLLLSMIGYCQGYMSAQAGRWGKNMAGFGILLTGWSIAIGIVLGIGSCILLLRKFNPWFAILIVDMPFF